MRDYTIFAETGPNELLLLAKDAEDPWSPARIHNRALPGSLSDAKPVLDLAKSNIWCDYTGPQDALAIAIPETIFKDSPASQAEG